MRKVPLSIEHHTGRALTLVPCCILCLYCGGLSAAWAQQQTDSGARSSATTGPPATQPVLRTKYTDPLVRVEAARLRQFDNALAVLSTQAKVAFIAEGTPLHPILSERDWKALEQALPNDGAAVPLSEVVAHVVRAFDYEAVRTNKDLFLLFKRYSDPKDLPFVTFEEAVRSLRNIVRATDRLNPHVTIISENDPNDPFRRFLRSLDPQQTQVLRQKAAMQDGVPFLQFRPDQRTLFVQHAAHEYLNRSLNPVERTAQHLEATRHESAVFRRMDLLGLGIQQVFGYEMPSGSLRAPLPTQIVLSHGFRIQTGGGGMSGVVVSGSMIAIGRVTDVPGTPTKRFMEIIREKFARPLPDPNAPTAQEYADAQRETPQPSGSTIATLQSVVERLNAANATTGSGTETASAPGAEKFRGAAVDEALQAKPVSIVGVDALAPERVLQALADVYGLHVQHQTDGTRLLTTRPMRLARAYGEIPETVRRFVPEPWQRALLGVARSSVPALMEQEERARQERGRATPTPGDLESRRNFMNNLVAPMGAGNAINDVAVRRLRARVEPRLASAPGKRLPMSQIGQEDRRLLALLCSSELLYPLYNLMSLPVPHTLTDFEHAYVKGVFDPNTGELQGAHLCYRDENGILRREFGADWGADPFPVPAIPANQTTAP